MNPVFSTEILSLITEGFSKKELLQARLVSQFWRDEIITGKRICDFQLRIDSHQKMISVLNAQDRSKLIRSIENLCFNIPVLPAKQRNTTRNLLEIYGPQLASVALEKETHPDFMQLMFSDWNLRQCTRLKQLKMRCNFECQSTSIQWLAQTLEEFWLFEGAPTTHCRSECGQLRMLSELCSMPNKLRSVFLQDHSCSGDDIPPSAYVNLITSNTLVKLDATKDPSVCLKQHTLEAIVAKNRSGSNLKHLWIRLIPEDGPVLEKFLTLHALNLESIDRLEISNNQLLETGVPVMQALKRLQINIYEDVQRMAATRRPVGELLHERKTSLERILATRAEHMFPNIEELVIWHHWDNLRQITIHNLRQEEVSYGMRTTWTK